MIIGPYYVLKGEKGAVCRDWKGRFGRILDAGAEGYGGI